jgi:transposase
MASDDARARKRTLLKRQGTLNPHAQLVVDPLFQSREFFDADDVVQVKYEMLRRVKVDNQPVTQSAAAFGFSRPTYYQTETDFDREGLFGLVPQKRGPRQAHKLTPEVLDFVRELRAGKPRISTAELASAIEQRFQVAVHRRSIERALARQEKKRL